MLQKKFFTAVLFLCLFCSLQNSSGSSSDSSNNHRSFFVIIAKKFGQKSKTEIN
jgi:hypothetical protein